MLDIEPILLQWIEAPLREQQTTIDVSQHAHSILEVEGMLRDTLHGKKLEITPDKIASREKVISDWFCANDGKSGMRVADAIMETLEGNKENSDISYLHYIVLLMKGFFQQQSFKHFLMFITRAFIGSKLYNQIKKRIQGIAPSKAKEYSLSDVQTVIDRLEKADDDDISVNVTANPRYYSVAIKRAILNKTF
jgi:hypothetical protein